MTAPIDIANRALGQIKAGKRIARFDENSVEANACDQFYGVARNTALAAFDWSFSRRYAQLALLPDAPLVRWTFAYRYPADCLKVRQLPFSDRRHDGYAFHNHPLRFDLGSSAPHEIASDADGQIILTDEPNAIIVYSACVENPDHWSAMFQQCVVFLMASYIAIPITGQSQLATANLQYYQQQLEEAKLHSAQEGKDKQLHILSAVEARL